MRKCSLLRLKRIYLRLASSIFETNSSLSPLLRLNGNSDIHWLRGGTMNRRGFLASVAALPGAAS
jgi:hypothetical protein